MLSRFRPATSIVKSLAVSVLLLVPCCWQAHIQAGDLASHIYNAWLAQHLAAQPVAGLVVVHSYTNVLFDLLLSAMLPVFGPEGAQRIAVGFAVLIFIRGAFAFGRAISGRTPWAMLPCIAMVAYGFVFHIGFFNFYLSLGLCLWAIGLLCGSGRPRIAWAAPVLALACLAHPLPVGWALGITAYTLLARRLAPMARLYAFLGAIAGLAALRAAIVANLTTEWSRRQVWFVSGLDQVRVFDVKYSYLEYALLLVWGVRLFQLLRQKGVRTVVTGVPFQLCAISALAVLLIPNVILMPGYDVPISLIAERMSLPVAVCVCALLSGTAPSRLEHAGLAAVALLFFVCLYRDERVLNLLEMRIRRAVAAVPAGARVISGLYDADLRVNALEHLIDRACLEHCYSYGNYEPSSGQFRVRAVAKNELVVFPREGFSEFQSGRYVPVAGDLPMYQIESDQTGRIFVTGLQAGIRMHRSPLHILALPGPARLQ